MLGRIRRILHIALVTFALLLTLISLAGTFFPRNFGPYPSGYRDRSVATFFVSSYPHTFQIYFLTHPLVPRTPGGGGSHDAGQDISFLTIFYHFGIAYQHADYINNSTNLVEIRGHEFTIPYWMLSVLFLILAFFFAIPFLRRLRRSRRDPLARPCPSCQYDLRAHLAAGNNPTCPECGTKITAK